MVDPEHEQPEDEPGPEIPPPLRVPEEYPGEAPRPDRRRADPEVPDLPDQPWF